MELVTKQYLLDTSSLTSSRLLTPTTTTKMIIKSFSTVTRPRRDSLHLLFSARLARLGMTGSPKIAPIRLPAYAVCTMRVSLSHFRYFHYNFQGNPIQSFIPCYDCAVQLAPSGIKIHSNVLGCRVSKLTGDSTIHGS